MSYQTGTAVHLDDLLGKLDVFLVANGWTQDKFVAGSGDGHSSEYYWHKGASYFAFEAGVVSGNQSYHGIIQVIDLPWLQIYGATGHAGGSTIDNQPNTSIEARISELMPNMTAYHFFTDPAQTYIHVVVETTANEFRHIICGLCNKLGAYDGGEYVIAHEHAQTAAGIDVPDYFIHHHPFHGFTSNSLRPSKFHCNIDGVRWKQYYFNTVFSSMVAPAAAGNSGFPNDIVWNSGADSALVAQPNSFNNQPVLMNISCGFTIRSSTVQTPVGHFPDVRAINIKNIVPSSTLVLGGDTWHVFPICEKKEPDLRDDLPNSGWKGIAYLEVP